MLYQEILFCEGISEVTREIYWQGFEIAAKYLMGIKELGKEPIHNLAVK